MLAGVARELLQCDVDLLVRCCAALTAQTAQLDRLLFKRVSLQRVAGRFRVTMTGIILGKILGSE